MVESQDGAIVWDCVAWIRTFHRYGVVQERLKRLYVLTWVLLVFQSVTACKSDTDQMLHNCRKFIGSHTKDMPSTRTNIKQDGIKPQTLRVITFNMENFFDAKHQEGHHDFLYLPKAHPAKSRCSSSSQKTIKSSARNPVHNAGGSSNIETKCMRYNWTQQNVASKARQLATVMKEARRGEENYLVFMQEIEVGEASQMLQKHGPIISGSEISVHVTHQHDRRGLGVGVLANQSLFNKLQFKELLVDAAHSPLAGMTRPVLKVVLTLPQMTMIFYAGHFPSQASSFARRLQAWSRIMSDMTQELQDSSVRKSMFVVGDLNVTDREGRKLQQAALEQTGEPVLDSFDIFYGSDKLWEYDSSRDWGPPYLYYGTYFYKLMRQWLRFDRIYITQSACSDLLRPIKYEVIRSGFQLTSFRIGKYLPPLSIPKKFSKRTRVKGGIDSNGNRTGVSDHLPVAMDFETSLQL